MRTDEIVAYLDDYLDVSNVPDYAGAVNGLQVANSGSVERVAVAVDATLGSIEAAVADGADLLLVHHGLFWDGGHRVTGRRYRRLRAVFDADLAVYSAHIPLDVHPEVGNNAVLAAALGVEGRERFGEYKGQPMGYWGRVDVDREVLLERLGEIVGGPVKLVPGGPSRIRTLGVITGGAGSEVTSAIATGLDAFVTGEGAHHNFFDAEEGGINLYLAGHYATETWGVRALAEHLERKFELPWSFIDRPTGL